jgi:aminoglycoside 3-N-acetyltransferase
MAIKDNLRKLMPERFLRWYRKRRKNRVRENIEKQRTAGEGFTHEDLRRQLSEMGIAAGDSVLVHSSLSKMGYIAGGPGTVIQALLDSVGPLGNVLMPTSPNDGRQLDYVRDLDVFDVLYTPSRLGIISETFRKHPRAIRSGSATEPVSCIGADAEHFVSGHIDQQTPYDDESPFYKLAEAKGKILYVGCTLDNAGTSLHLLEDAVPDFKFPVYYPEKFEVKIRDARGELQQRNIKVHNPEMSAKRRCDELIPMFEQAGVMKRVLLGSAATLLFEAGPMLELMLQAYHEKGVTMYTPKGD